MLRFLSCLSLVLSLAAAASAQSNQAPVISNISALPDWSSGTITVQYDLVDAENDAVEITVEVSNTNGQSYTLTALAPSTGDLGPGVAPGAGKTVVIDVADLVATSPSFTVRVTADDHQPLDLAALVAAVDSNRLRSDLEFVEGVRHRNTGAAHLAAVRDSMAALFAAAGLYVEDQSFTYTNYTGHNIAGHLPGTASQQVVVIDAHYDTVNNAPGADDNGSGTVGVWEAARILSRYPSQKALRFIGFDLEEAGLIGSQRYVTSLVNNDVEIAGVFNFEMIGYYSDEPNSQTLPTGFNLLFPNAYNAVAADDFRGNFITNVGNTASQALVTLFDTTAAALVPGLRVISVAVPGNGEIAQDLRRSDHTPFWEGGYPALMLTDGANFRNECYHTPSDTLDDKLNFTFMANVVRATVAAAANLAGLQHGDWATVTVQSPVNTFEAGRCVPRALFNPEEPATLIVQPGNCAIRSLVVELLDAKGATLFNETVAVWEGQQEYRVPLPQPRLAAGVYLARLHYGNQTRTVKLVLP
jgi:hypothetical protein